ncbi:MAG: threonine/serine dehydratase [Anaerolineales bacterium]
MTEPIPLAEIEAARGRIAGAAIRTPLVRLNASEAPAEIYLKLENLQPIGSFKLRGAGNAIGKMLDADGAIPAGSPLHAGVFTASAGNMAQGVAWNAQRLGIPCTVLVPAHAPETKLAAIRRLGSEIVKISFDEWWEIILYGRSNADGHFTFGDFNPNLASPLPNGVFIHPVSDPAVMAGNGTIGLEIVEDLPDMDAVVIPYGGGGLMSGIGSAVKARAPQAKVFAAEVDTAAPLSASLAAGEVREVDYTPTFVDGAGGKTVLPDMWPRVRKLVDASLVVTVEQAAAAVRLLIERNRVVAEGAGALPVAAALAGMAGVGKVVCIVSGGNIDSVKIAKILQGELP